MESPFSQFLNTNFSPSDDEILEINRYLIKSTSDFAELEAQVAELQQRKDRLRKDIDGHKAFLSPIRRLSEDLLIEIFLLCLPTEHDAVMHAFVEPLKLGRICSSWRSLAYRTPLLWASLHLVVPSMNKPSSYKRIWPPLFSVDRERANAIASNYEVAALRCEAASEWLKRARNSPLSITVQSSSQSIGMTRAISSSLQTIIPFSHQWRHLTLRLAFADETLSLFSSLLPGQFPLLQTVHLDRVSNYQNGMEKSANLLQNIFLHAPHMDTLRLSHFTVLAIFGMKINFQQLTDLDMGRSSLTEVALVNILRQSPYLVRCSIQLQDLDDGWGGFSWSPPSDSNDHSPIFLPRLQELKASSQVSFSFSLAVPKLRYFELDLTAYNPWIRETSSFMIDIGSGTDEDWSPHLSSSESTPSLHEVVISTPHIASCPFSITSLLLRTNPRKLTLAAPWRYAFYHNGENDSLANREDSLLLIESLMEKLTPTPDDLTATYLCPDLEYLEITSEAYFSIETLLKLIRARQAVERDDESGDPSRSKLRQVVVDFVYPQDLGEYIPELDGLLNQGWKISLRWPDDSAGLISAFTGIS